jgi:hypothetical protein
MAAMLEFRTQGYNPYAVKYSPYYDSRIAVATSANFGIVGNGRVFALALTAQGVQVEKTYAMSRCWTCGVLLEANSAVPVSIQTMRCTTWLGPRLTRTS